MRSRYEVILGEIADDNLLRAVPLSLLTVDGNGKASVDKAAILDSREKKITIDISKPYKLNAGTSGVCSYPVFPSRPIY